MASNHARSIAILFLAVAGCASVPRELTREQREALAPTGKLRVAFLATTPIHATRDGASGELRGPAVDLGKEMARRIGVGFQPVAYTSLGPILAGAKSGEWDVAMLGVSAERAQVVDFTTPYMVVEFGFLVPDGSPIRTVADTDQPGVRIAVLDKSSPDAYLSGTIKRATLIRLPTLANVIDAVRTGTADALFATKATALSESAKIAGSRVLEGDVGGENTALAVPKGRQFSASYARRFVEESKSAGLVQAAIERAGLRGVVVPPAK